MSTVSCRAPFRLIDSYQPLWTRRWPVEGSIHVWLALVGRFQLHVRWPPFVFKWRAVGAFFSVCFIRQTAVATCQCACKPVWNSPDLHMVVNCPQKSGPAEVRCHVDGTALG